MGVAEGAYSIVMSTEKALYAFRDPWGVRPLCFTAASRAADYIFASESCALATVGAEYLRELEPGEIIWVDAEGLHVDKAPQPKPHALCMFEYIYFARPDSILNGTSIYMARLKMGRQLAREHPVDADVVMAVPDSAVRDAGAREVHVRITSPPIINPCYLGVDMATRDELIAVDHTIEEIRQTIGADSLGYLSRDGLLQAVARKRGEMCLGCLTGEYPETYNGPSVVDRNVPVLAHS